MYKLKSGIAYIAAAAVIVALWVYWISNRVSVSVIVPVYNSEKFLSRCLDSIVAQKGSFEIIAVNDGSTDKSRQILEAYAQKYKNIIVVNQENKGVSAARNQGMAKANGKYITFVDSDDWLEPDALARAVSILRQDSPDILLVGFYDVYDHEWVRRTGGEAAVSEAPEEAKFPTRKLDKLALFSPFQAQDAHSDLFYAGTGVRGQFFKNEFVKKNKLSFPLGVKCGEDDVFVYRSFLHNPLISILPEPLYSYRNRLASLAKAERIITDNRKTLALLQKTEEYQKAGRRTQMLINDTWLSWTILGISNLARHGASLAAGLEEAYQAYNTFSAYNTEERKSCRNLERLRKILFNYSR